MTLLRALADGEAVTEAGAYRCTMSWYHGQGICPGPSISSTGLRKIALESPWHFWASSDLNPDRYPEPEPSDALVLGRAAHALILGDEVFDDAFCFVPKDAPRRPTAPQVAAFERDGRWSDAAAPGAAFWIEFDARAAGRLLLSEAQVEHIMRMAANLRRNPLAVEMLTGGLTEVSLIWQDPTGVWLKARPDVMPDAGADFADLKTFQPRSRSIKRAVHQAITDHGYALQMALAIMGAEAVFGISKDDCVLVMAQSNAPYTVTPVRLDPECLYWARVQLRHAIDTFARCMESGEWPMPVEGVLDYSLPGSLLQRLGEMQAAGDLPILERTDA